MTKPPDRPERPDRPDRLKRLNPGERIDCEIDILDGNGLGTAKSPAGTKPGTMTVEDALPGETGRALILAAGQHRAHARLLERSGSSPVRRDPLPCLRWTAASPCRVMHLSPDEQLSFKQRRVQAAFAEHDLDPGVVAATRAAPSELRWRARVTYIARRRGPEMVLGSYQRGTHVVQSMAGCPLEEAAIADAAEALRVALSENDVPSAEAPGEFARDNGCGAPATEAELIASLSRPRSAQDRAKRGNRGGTSRQRRRPAPDEHAPRLVPSDRASKTAAESDGMMQRGLRFVVLRSNGAGRVVAILLTPSGELHRAGQVAETARQVFPGFAGIYLGKSGPGDRILGDDPVHCVGKAETLEEEVAGLKLRVSPKAFFQVNRSAANELQQFACEALGATQQSVLELYAGVGVLALRLAKLGHRVTAVEAVPEAVNDARGNTKLNELSEAQFWCLDAAAAFERIAQKKLTFDSAVINPPRKGCAPEVIAGLAALGTQRIVYVSCNPTTLARDASALKALGYAVTAATPFDLFPQSEHVECVATLVREA
jgi:tRNA/tmRNA/rRNA uracil-C5-methylase (TrmA/RlmC/RlmD family)